MPGDGRNDTKKTYDDEVCAAQVTTYGSTQSPAPSEQSLGSGRLTVDAGGILNDDSSNEALVVDYDSPKCSPGKLWVGVGFGLVVIWVIVII